MKEVLVRTKPKDSFTLVVSDNSANIQTTFNPPLYLQANRNELAMVNLETYYSFANIRGDNNSFKWNADGGKTWTILHVPTGCYELKAINAEIIRIRGNSDITILPNVNTLQCILIVVGAKCKVSFDVPNSLASVLGFKQSTVYGVGRHASALQHYSFSSSLNNKRTKIQVTTRDCPQLTRILVKGINCEQLSQKYIGKIRRVKKRKTNTIKTLNGGMARIRGGG